MTAANWPNCFALTVASEGGYDRNPKDRGNWTSGVIGQGELKGTKYGVAAFVYPTIDIKNLTLDQARDIYKRDYWPKVAGDQQPEGVDLVAWDICVNSGPARALKIEGQALNSTSSTARGLAELAKLASDKVAVVKRMCALRASFYRSLKTFETFGNGWLARNARMEANGVRMALAATGMPHAEIKDKLEKEAGQAKTTANKHGTGAAASGGGGPVATTQFDWSQFDWLTISEIAVAAVVIIGLTIYFIRKYQQHDERAQAYAAAAAGTGV